MIRYCYKCEAEVELLEDEVSNAGICSVCGTVLLRSASKLSPGTMLNGFQIINEIGRGGMGIVYRANQLNLDREVAVKVLADDLANDEEFVENFFKEARAAASLNHQNIVQVYDAGMTTEGIYYFVMELIDGDTIESRLDKEVRLEPDEAVYLALKVSQALDYAWKAKQLTHGDIKPDNIIMNRDGSVKLADLGLAKCVHEEFSASGLMATPLYAPPEVIKSEYELIGCHSDMYSLGVTLFQMLAGTPPFPNDSTDAILQKHLTETPPSLLSYNPRLSESLVDLVNKLLEKNPEDRPVSWREVCNVLESIEEAEPELEIHNNEHHEQHKVFRAGSHLQGRGGHRPQKQMVLQTSGKGNFGKRLVFVAVVAILVVATLVFINKNRDSSNVGKDDDFDIVGDDSAVGGSIANVEVSSRERFEHIREKFASKPLKRQISILEKFLKEEGDKAPLAARDLMVDLKRKLEVQVSARKREGFKERVKGVERYVSSLDAKKLSDSQIDEVREKLHEVEKMRAELASEDYLSGCDAFESRLVELKSRLKSCVDDYDKRSRLAKLAAEKERIRQLEESRSADTYYAIIAAFRRDGVLGNFKLSLSAWLNSVGNLSNDYVIRGRFLHKLFAKFRSVNDCIFKNASVLCGKKLPSSICPEKYRGFKVKKVTKLGFVFSSNRGKVIIEKKLNWSKMGLKRLSNLIIEMYLVRKSGIDEDTFNTFMMYLLLKQPELLSGRFEKIRFPSDESRGMWKNISVDFNNAERESTVAMHFSKLLKMVEDGDIANAAEYYHEVKNEIESTDFEKRHLGELKVLTLKLFSLSPEMMACNAMRMRAINRGSSEKTAGILVLQGRYWNVLVEKQRRKLTELKLDCYKELLGSQNLTSSNHCAPFFEWSHEVDGCALAYYRFLEKSSIFGGRKNLANAFYFASALQIGDWEIVKKYFSDLTQGTVSSIQNNQKYTEWAGSLGFAVGVVADRYFQPKKSGAALKYLRDLSSVGGKSELMVLNTALSLELAMMTGKNNMALEIGKDYKYKAGALMDAETRIVMLSFLALLESSQNSDKRIEDIYLHVLRKNMKLRSSSYDDRTWCDIAIEILKGDITQRRLDELEKTNCKYKDTALRIIMAAFARNLYSGSGFNEKITVRILKFLRKNSGSGFYASATRRSLFLMELSFAKNITELRYVLSESMKDYAVSGLYYYPELVVLWSGCDYLDGVFDIKKTVGNIEQYFAASLLVSDNFKQLSKLILDKGFSKRIGEMMRSGAFSRAYICIMLEKILNYKEHSKRGDIENGFNVVKDHYSWEEKLFMRNLDKILLNRSN